MYPVSYCGVVQVQSKTSEHEDAVVVRILNREQTEKKMIGEPTRLSHHGGVPPWDPPFPDVISSSANFNANAWGYESVMPVDVFSSDYFRMFDFKIRRCVRARAHDWTECPYAHPGEKARRRDLRKYHYSGTPCEEFRKGTCRKGDSCQFAHGVFECWLHPTRYRTQPCKDGVDCHRRVCFFAHSPEQLRIVNLDAQTSEGAYELFVSSPTSILVSPPLSPVSEVSPRMSESVSEIVSSMKKLHLARKKKSYPCQWKFDKLSACEYWGRRSEEEEPAVERVESGKNLRVKLYAKLSKENSLGRNESPASFPDIGWVSELIK